MQPRTFRRRRRAYLAACKLSLLLTTAFVAGTQTSRLPNSATRYWHIVMFALLYGRGVFLGMATLFLQVTFAVWLSAKQGEAVSLRSLWLFLVIKHCEAATPALAHPPCCPSLIP